jgi:hypothetical protein
MLNAAQVDECVWGTFPVNETADGVNCFYFLFLYYWIPDDLPTDNPDYSAGSTNYDYWKRCVCVLFIGVLSVWFFFIGVFVFVFLSPFSPVFLVQFGAKRTLILLLALRQSPLLLPEMSGISLRRL